MSMTEAVAHRTHRVLVDFDIHAGVKFYPDKVHRLPTHVKRRVSPATVREPIAYGTHPIGTWVALLGNPIDGYTIWGPFLDAEDAQKWADEQKDEWWVYDLGFRLND